MNLLLSNDDGYGAPGIGRLCQIASHFGDVSVVAPRANMSAKGHALTIYDPISVERIDDKHLIVDGTPADCVHLALTGLLPHQPDMVLAGINAGCNLGDDVFYSGTVAAAMEARFLEVPAMAISMADAHGRYIDTAISVVKTLLERVIKQSLPGKAILNVNIPACDLSDLKGISVTRLGRRRLASPAIKVQDIMGHEVYKIGAAGAPYECQEGTDFYAIKHQYVSVTPLLLDITRHEQLDAMTQWVGELCFE